MRNISQVFQTSLSLLAAPASPSHLVARPTAPNAGSTSALAR